LHGYKASRTEIRMKMRNSLPILIQILNVQKL
jgi:hypothetical protein